MDLYSEQMVSFGVFWTILPLLGTILVHLAFSAAVFNDANRMTKEQRHLIFVNSWLWSLAVLVGGVFIAVAYWLVHHSTMARR